MVTRGFIKSRDYFDLQPCETASESSCDDYLLDDVNRSTTPMNSKRDIPARKERNTTKNVGPEALKKSRLNRENTREEKNLNFEAAISEESKSVSGAGINVKFRMSAK